MTRDEALYRVKGYLTDIIPVENYSEVEEIFKALKPKPCEDSISRQDVINTIRREVFWCDDLIDEIKSFPFVQSEWRKGKWITDGHHIRCNQCGIYFCNSDREGDTLPRNFCPNCGADMRGANDEAD